MAAGNDLPLLMFKLNLGCTNLRKDTCDFPLFILINWYEFVDLRIQLYKYCPEWTFCKTR